MESNQFLKEKLETGQYFSDAISWYHTKYVLPFSHRSFIFAVSITMIFIFTGLILNLRGLFPLVVQVKYPIMERNATDKRAQIIRADQVDGDPFLSITDIFVRNYVTKRESYNYDNLKPQFVFVKNNSTRIAFKRFYNEMSIDNPTSPVMKFQKQASRIINITESNYDQPGKAIIKFESKAQNKDGTIVENILWQATIDYEIDTIETNLPPGSRFNFTVTNYQLQLLQDKKNK